MGAHSYTTVSVKPDGTARIRVTLCPDEFVAVLCPRGKDRALISVMHAAADVVIAPLDSAAPTAGDVRAARKLAESFAAYAAEVERLHAQNDEPGGSSGGERVA